MMKKFIFGFWFLVFGGWCLVSCHPTAQRSYSEQRERSYSVSGPLAQRSKVAITSTTHRGFLSALGLDSCIVMDCSNTLTPDVERLVMSGANLVFVTSYGTQEPAWCKQARKAGLRLVEINEWQEPTPLQRAEWIRVFGREMGCEAKADSIYASVAAKYDSLCQLPFSDAQRASGLSARSAVIQRSGHSAQRSTIMSGSSFRGTWYVPSGTTFMGALFRDAGARYKYADSDYKGSIPLTMEQAIVDFADSADVWVGVDVRSLAELRAMDERHTWFKAYREGRVYNFLKRTAADGTNDFWQRGVVHPEEILEDLLHALYPDVDPEYEFVYMGGVGE